MSALCCILIPRMLLTLRCLRNTLLSRRLMDEPVFRVFVFLARHSVPVGVPPPSVSGSVSILDEVRILFVTLPSFTGGGKKRKR